MSIRVLFTINNLDTAGMKYVLSDIVNGIDKNIFTPVIVVNQKTGSKLEQSLASKFELHEINLRNPGSIKFITTLLKNAQKIKAIGQITHSFDYSSDWNEAVTMKVAGIPFVAEKTNLSFESYRWKIKLGLANHIVCLSTVQAKHLGKYSKKLTIIPTGIDVRKFIDVAPVNRSEWGLKKEDVVFISVAHLVEVKGYEELINAIASLKDIFPAIKIVCLGKGEPEYELHLKNVAQNAGVIDRILFVGNSENVAGWLKAADIKILATQNKGRREAFGAAIIEAMAAGLPVIATKSGGPEDIVLEGKTGWLVNGDGPPSLAEGIKVAMSERYKWEKMGATGRQRVTDHYGISKMVDAYSKVYKALANL